MFKLTNHPARTLAMLPLICAMAFAAGPDDLQASARQDGRPPLFLTATNGAANSLVVINTRSRETNYVPTGGSGGAGGNAGGVAVEGSLAAAVNFGSSDVTIFVRRGNSMAPTQKIKTASPPVSVAFGHDHLVVLGLTTAESFAVSGGKVAATADGTVQLARADKSAGQIVSFDGGVVYSEKSGSVAELKFASGAGLTGPNLPVDLPNAPLNDTPFGMIARGANVYVAIAHSDLEVLVADGKIVASAAGPMPYVNPAGGFFHAPCWNALYGQFLYSADSPGKQLLRFLVSDANVFFDKPQAATFSGPPTDLTVEGNLMGVIDGGNGTISNVSLFDINSEGELQLRFAVPIASKINGAALIR